VTDFIRKYKFQGPIMGWGLVPKVLLHLDINVGVKSLAISLENCSSHLWNYSFS